MGPLIVIAIILLIISIAIIIVKTYVIRRLDRTGDECYATKEIPSKILGNPLCNIKNKETKKRNIE